MLDLQPIKARLAAATPGQWEAKETSSSSRRHTFFPVAVVGRWEVIADLPSQARPDKRDADLIANAPADLAALVAEVERLRIAVDMYRRITGDNEAEIKRLRGAIEAHRTQCHKTYKVAQAWWDEDLWAVLDA